MGTVHIRFREDGGSKWLEGLWQVYQDLVNSPREQMD
jgi:hypothetical protein